MHPPSSDSRRATMDWSLLEEAPIPGGHAVVHGEEQIDQVEAGMMLAIGNCGIHREGYGVRAEDTVAVGDDGPVELTRYPRHVLAGL